MVKSANERKKNKLEPQLVALYELLAISGDVTSSLPELVNRALKGILRATSASSGIIYLLESDRLQLTLVAQQNAAIWNDQQWSTISIDHPLIKNIFDQGEFLLLSPRVDEKLLAQLSLNAPLSQLVGFPISNADRDLGILLLLLGKGDFEPAEIQNFVALAGQLAIIIDNFRFREQAGRLLIIEERNRLARELHDSVTQALYSTSLFAEAAQRHAQAGNIDKTIGYLAELSETSQQALKEMRLLLHRLRPSPLEKDGLIRALQQRLKAVEGRAGISSEFKTSDSLTIPRELEAPLYFLAQEALNNSLKHSRATTLKLEIRTTPEKLLMTIEDNGKGFDLVSALNSGGSGLTNMHEHASQLHGELEVITSPGSGSKVLVTVPFPAPKENYLS